MTIENRTFTPASIVVAAGTTVTWTNKDKTPHSVTSGVPGARDGTFDRTMAPNVSEFNFTFDKPGVYTYFCQFHTTMLGQVEVR